MAGYAKRESVVSQVVEWNRSWVMMGGFVACTECLEFQTVEYFGEPFKHAPGCGRAVDGQENPWVALEAILSWTANFTSSAPFFVFDRFYPYKTTGAGWALRSSVLSGKAEQGGADR